MKLWNYLSGKKTVIGAAVAFIYYGAVGIGLIEPNQAVEGLILGWLGVGLGHKVVKSA